MTEHDGECESYLEQGPRLPVLPCGCVERAASKRSVSPVFVTVVEWWCPSSGSWVVSAESCPDGSVHTESRTRDIPVRVPPRLSLGAEFSPDEVF